MNLGKLITLQDRPQQSSGETQNKLNGRWGRGSKPRAWEADSDERYWMRECDQNTSHKIIISARRVFLDIFNANLRPHDCCPLSTLNCPLLSTPCLSLNSCFCFVLRTSGLMQGHLYVCGIGTPIRAAGLNSGKYLVGFSWNNLKKTMSTVSTIDAYVTTVQ